jgi:hypothetical protein
LPARTRENIPGRARRYNLHRLISIFRATEAPLPTRQCSAAGGREPRARAWTCAFANAIRQQSDTGAASAMVHPHHGDADARVGIHVECTAMRITFLGAAREVTGSGFLMETGSLRFPADCGPFEALARNRAALAFDVRGLDFALLIDAHID